MKLLQMMVMMLTCVFLLGIGIGCKKDPIAEATKEYKEGDLIIALQHSNKCIELYTNTFSKKETKENYNKLIDVLISMGTAKKITKCPKENILIIRKSVHDGKVFEKSIFDMKEIGSNDEVIYYYKDKNNTIEKIKNEIPEGYNKKFGMTITYIFPNK